MPFDFAAVNTLSPLSSQEFPIEQHIVDVCCCSECGDNHDGHDHAGPDFAFDLLFDAGAGDAETQNQYGKPSFSWDEAALQISRWNAKWDDEDDAGGVLGNIVGTPGTVTFGFLSDPTDSEARAMTVAEIARTLEGINEFEEIANLTFIRVQDAGSEYIANNADAEMDFQAEDGSNGGYATPSWSSGTLQTSTVNIGVLGHADYGSWSYKTTIHEIGHAVGLPHPGDYNGSGANGYVESAEYAEDTYMYTVMSYFSHAFTGGDTFETVTGAGGETAQIGGYATGLLLHDIAALQRLYGANLETRDGDTVYGFNSTEASDSHWNLADWKDFFVAAIWDGGGNDTIDASGYYEDQSISLLEESFSSLGGLTFNLSIARGVTIENAIGGAGNDRLKGNGADNILNGGEGLDTVDFSEAASGINFDLSSSSFSLTGLGTDTLISIEGVVGTNFDDVLIGTDEDNFFEMLDGNDTITGGLGTDWISLRGAADGVTINAHSLSSGTFSAAGIGTNTFTSIEGLEGTQYDDTFNGDASQQFYRGGDGNDTFVVSAGADTYDGGAGLDTLDFRASTSGVDVHLGTGQVYVSGSFGAFTQINFEHVHMTDFGDRVSATSDANIIYTYAGDDVIYAQQGNDYVEAGAGDDYISGWYGNDTLIAGDGNDDVEGDFGNDIIDGGAGVDNLMGGDGDDQITGGAGADVIDGGEGTDTASYATSASGVAVDLAATGIGGDAEGDTLVSVENILGSEFADTLTGDGQANALSGGSGDDVLEGKGGADSFDGGAGSDTVSYANSVAGVTVDLSAVGIGSDADGDTFSSIENILGSGFDDSLIGDLNSNNLSGGDGNDTINGSYGVNTLTGGAGADTFVAFSETNSGDDTVTDFDLSEDFIDLSGLATFEEADAAFQSMANVNGNAVITLPDGSKMILTGVDATSLQRSSFIFPTNDGIIDGDGEDNILNGTSVADVINGFGGDDILSGFAGADTLNGGDGNDVLNGGDAPDISSTEGFVYRLYLATLDRAPDATGLRGWVDILDGGSNTQVGVAAGFVASTEFQSTYGSLDDLAFVELLYNNVLNRASDPAGLQGWLDALSSGSTRADVVIGFSNSAEFISNTEYSALGYFSELIEGNLGAVFRAYGAVLDRAPDTGGFLGWLDRLDTGAQTLQEVIDGFTGSQEFQTRYGSLNDTEFVSLLYNNVLDRAPDAGGLQGWLDALENGTTRAQVVLGFSQSAEYISSSDAALTSFIETMYVDSADIIDGGSGNDSLFGGRGADTFMFAADADGSDTVFGLDQFDTVQLAGFGYSSATDAMAFMVQTGRDVVFNDQGVTITFADANLTDVQQTLDLVLSSPTEDGAAMVSLIEDAHTYPNFEAAAPTSIAFTSARDLLDEDFFV